MSSLPFPAPWPSIRKRVLSEVKPSKREHEEIDEFRAKLCVDLAEALRRDGVVADVEVHGSVARDTWLVGQRDIDTFIILPRGTRRDLLRVNEAVKRFVGEGWVEAYAEHPYVKKEIGGYEVEFIPCFHAIPGKGIMSATDRTPLHTAYLQPRLTDELRDDVRVLKAFIKGIGVYGAEIKIGGFSGYLCELLVLAHGGFEPLIEAAAKWGEHPTVTFEKAKTDAFKEPLVVVDPVDAGRNVASAVNDTSLWTFVAAARHLRRTPSGAFFWPTTRDTAKLAERLDERGTNTLFIVIPDPTPPVPDTLWGQLHRTEKALGRALADRGFNVFRTAAWSDETTRHILVYEIESVALPPVVKKIGPPVRLAKDSDDFLSRYMGSPDLVAGPGVEGGKWWVEVKRERFLTTAGLKSAIVGGYEELGVPKHLAELIEKEGAVYVNGDVAPELRGDFPAFLDAFIRGRPDWLG